MGELVEGGDDAVEVVGLGGDGLGVEELKRTRHAKGHDALAARAHGDVELRAAHVAAIHRQPLSSELVRFVAPWALGPAPREAWH